MEKAPETPASAFQMIPLSEALETVLSLTKPLPTQSLRFDESYGHTVAHAVRAVDPVPGYRASIKDGYAVLSSDGPGEYPIAFEAHAGSHPSILKPGDVAYIGTGGPVPDGADAVVQIEDTIFLGENRVKILKQVHPGEDIREIGSDLKSGEIIMNAGEDIASAEVGMLATAGAVHVEAHSTPVVAVLSTGDEVQEPFEGPLVPGKVRDANRMMLVYAARAVGASALDLGIVRDSEEQVETAIDRAIESGANIIITTGGVSMGNKDFVKPILSKKGTIHFGKICMKPGKPCTFATITRATNGNPSTKREVYVFGLPGNPVSALTTFHLLVVPCIRRLRGLPDPHLPRISVKTTFPIIMDPHRPEYRRAHVRFVVNDSEACSGTFQAYSTGGQISSRIMSFRSANALLEVPQRKGELPAGTVLPAQLLYPGNLEALLT